MPETAQTERAAKIDRWLLWPALASLGSVGFVTLICGLPGTVSFLLIPFSMLILYPTAAAVLAVLALICVLRKRPRLAASIVVAIIAPALAWEQIHWIADLTHLGLTVGAGIGQIGTYQGSDGSGFVAYDWSVGFAGGTVRFLVHDPTGKVGAPLTRHDDSEDLRTACAGNVRRLIAHYYTCTI